MQFSPSLISRLLLQPVLAPALRRSIVRAFCYESREWRLLDLVVLGPAPPATSDPVLLALRRLVTRDLVDLSAGHRLAAETAAERPFGLLLLVLEEAVCWSPGKEAPAAGDEPLRIFSELPPPQAEAAAYPRELDELRSRGLAEAERRQIALPRSSWIWRS